MLASIKMEYDMKSNGYGSFKANLVVRVKNEHVNAFSECFNVEPFEQTDEHSDFRISMTTRKQGDDETLMYEIDYRLPQSVPPFKGWKILWDQSQY